MKKSQTTRILEVLQAAKGIWTPASYIIRDMWITQCSARIVELRRKGYNIESTDEAGLPRTEHGFVSYRLIEEPEQKTLV